MAKKKDPKKKSPAPPVSKEGRPDPKVGPDKDGGKPDPTVGPDPKLALKPPPKG